MSSNSTFDLASCESPILAITSRSARRTAGSRLLWPCEGRDKRCRNDVAAVGLRGDATTLAAMSHGSVSSPSEYAEQKEFAATIAAKLAALPPKPEQRALVTEAARLQRAIDSKAEAKEVAGIAQGLAAALLATYPVPLAPRKAPNTARGAALFAQNCATCHGEAGD